MPKDLEQSAHSCTVKQYNKHVITGLLVLALNLLGPAWATGQVAKLTVSPDTARRAELVTLVRQDCGSCHGLTLKGGLGPALLPETLKDKSADYLKTVILHGRPDTAMPPWQRFLSEAEAEWIVFNLQKGFPSGH
ncbi:cytochrome c [Herminiimonas sp. CN]|uniref:c-type cytochrome n=1 Tax=Herminiimonas sp. CN TaxID=1349818 RepID=UPI00047350B1|nr:cytochrome c [Herminiimonas sp. CN]